MLVVLPMSTLPKARLVGLATNVRVVVAATPVPVRDAASAPSMLVEILTDPDMVPADCGVKCNVKETLFPPPIVTGRVSPVSVKADPEVELL